MAPITPPARSIPSTRRPQRQSFSLNSNGPDDISHLNLAQIRDRLARNERVLNSGLFSSSPTTGFVSSPQVTLTASQASFPLSSSPTSPSTGPASTSTMNTIATTTPGLGSISSTSSPSGDSVRDKLLAVRAQLKAREAELMLEGATSGMVRMDVSGNPVGRNVGDVNMYGNPGREGASVGVGGFDQSLMSNIGSGSSPNSGYVNVLGRRTSVMNGKQRALDYIRQQEEKMPSNGIMLPIAQSIALGDRDFENKTAAELAALTLDNGTSKQATPTKLDASTSTSTTCRPRRRRPRPSQRGVHEDEISRAEQSARINALYSRRGQGNTNGNGNNGSGGSAGYDDGYNYGDGVFDYDDDVDDDDEDDSVGGASGGGIRGRAGVSGDIFDDDGYDGGEEREYDGNGMPLDPDREDEAISGEMDEDEMDGEDNEHFSEGNEDYNLGGQGTLTGDLKGKH